MSCAQRITLERRARLLRCLEQLLISRDEIARQRVPHAQRHTARRDSVAPPRNPPSRRLAPERPDRQDQAQEDKHCAENSQASRVMAEPTPEQQRTTAN